MRSGWLAMLTNGIIIHKEDVPKQAYLLFFYNLLVFSKDIH